MDGVGIGVVTTTADIVEYEAETWLEAGDHTIGVAFTSDCHEEASGADRNLIVEWVGWAGPSDGVGSGAGGEAEARAWLQDFGGRAFRRPLTEAEEETWYTFFTQGPSLIGSGDDFADGVRLVLTAMLQSPDFLYRVESSNVPDATGRIPLSSHELASKLSYRLWGTMPDEGLFELASTDGLATAEQVREVAAVMLADDRAHAAVSDFYAQLLQLDKTANVVKNTDDFPSYTEETPGFLWEEAERFVDLVAWDQQGGLADLLAAPYTVGNASTAALYGVARPPDDTTWTQIQLDPTQRAGLLTQPWFLAVNAHSTTPSIIHRGVFVNRQILCADIPEPPPSVTPLPASEAGVTNRERVETHTGEGTCGAGCHATVINPPGYALEQYNALGMFRTTDGGEPADAASSYTFSTGSESWVDGASFARLLAAHPDTHACYTRQFSCLLSDDEAQAIASASGQGTLNDNRIQFAKWHMDLLALAFAYDYARAATLQIGDGNDSTEFTVEGQRLPSFHFVSHRIYSDGDEGDVIKGAWDMHHAIDRIFAGLFDHLLTRLDEHGVLAQSVAVWCNDLASGPAHGYSNVPYILAGEAGGTLRTGQYVDAGGVTNNQHFNTLLTAVGIEADDGGPVTDFGDPSLTPGLLDRLLA